MAVGAGSPAPSGGGVTDPTTTGVEGFIERLYTVALGRSSDPIGAQYWLNKVNNGNATGADLAQGFLYSPEFLSKNMTDEQFLDMLYGAFFNRTPDAPGKAHWLNQLRNGMSRQQVISGFINSVEWYNLCETYEIESGSAAAPRAS